MEATLERLALLGFAAVGVVLNLCGTIIATANSVNALGLQSRGVSPRDRILPKTPHPVAKVCLVLAVLLIFGGGGYALIGLLVGRGRGLVRENEAALDEAFKVSGDRPSTPSRGAQKPEERSVSDWAADLADPSPRKREAAANALSRLVGSENTDVVEPLVRALRDTAAATRLYAAKAIGRIGTGATAAESALEERARGDRDDRVRAAAREALARVRGRRS